MGLLADGVPLSPRLRPFELERDCEPGTFALSGPRLVVVPPASGGDLSLALAPDPTVGGDKGSLTWVYPGTTLQIHSTEPWPDPAPTFEILAMAFGSGTASFGVGGQDPVPLQGTGGLVSARQAGPPGDWVVHLTSPDDGPFLAIHALNLTNEDRRASFLADGRSGHQLTFDVIGRPVSRMTMSYAAYPPPNPPGIRRCPGPTPGSACSPPPRSSR